MRDTVIQSAARARAEKWARLRNWEWLAIAAVALGAFAIRAWTVRGGLPYVDHPDEPNPINYVVQMLRTGDPNPHFFQKPSLYIYLLLAVLTVHYRWGLATGLYGALDRMPITTHLYTTVPGFFLSGRMLTVVISTLTIVSLFVIGKRVWSRGAGLIGALFLAISPFHMRHSQYVTTDVTSGWLVLLAFGASIAVARGGRWRDYLAAGAFAGLAAATKYNAGVAALMVIAAHMIYWSGQAYAPHPVAASPTRKEREHDLPLSPGGSGRRGARGMKLSLIHLPRLIGAGAAALLGFAAGTPYAVLSWGEFRRGILAQVEDYTAITHGDLVGAWNLHGYANFFWNEGLGRIGCAAVVAGVALLLWRKREVGLLWLSFVVPYLLLHLAQSSHFMRNMVPLIVLGATPIGVAGAATIALFGQQATRARRRQDGKGSDLAPLILRVAAVAAVLLALLPGALETLRYSARLSHGDTRVQALNWIDANVPPGVRVAAELRQLPGPIESRWAEAPGLLQHDLDWYRQQGYGYLIASSDAWEQWAIPDSYRRFAVRAPIAEFGGADPRVMLGPHLVAYATGLTAADAPEPPPGDVRIGGARLAGTAVGLPEPKTPWLGVRPARILKAGDTLGLRTFWSVEQPFSQDFFIFVHLLDASGKTVAQRDAPPWQGRFPTSSWRAGTIVVDLNDLSLPKTLPPGDYTIAVGMYDPATSASPPMSVNGQAVDAVRIGQITIKK